MSYTLDTSGFDRINILRAMDKGADKGADKAVEKIVPLVPVSNINHKHLYETIQKEDIGVQGARRVSAGKDLPDARAIFVELGTVKMSAQPYMVPVMQDPALLDAVANGIREEIK